LAAEERAERKDGESIFRPEALEHQRFGGQRHGDVLRLSPDWINWTYRLLLGCFVAAVLYLCLGRMNDYATGPGIVRAKFKTEVTSPVSATVQEVAVAPGERVQAGQLLVRLVDEEQIAEVQRIEQELEVELAACLRDPLDEGARRSAASLRSQLQYARQMLAARRLTAPADGVIRDVRIRPGQSVSPGQLMATVSGPDSRLTLIVMLPGHFRPQLEVGQAGRLEISGYAHTYQPVALSKIAAEVIGPSEARRYLGQEIADAVLVDGPVVLVEATLAGESFTVDGRQYVYADGMQGQVQVRVRSVPIILNLVPGLRGIWGGRNRGFSD